MTTTAILRNRISLLTLPISYMETILSYTDPWDITSIHFARDVYGLPENRILFIYFDRFFNELLSLLDKEWDTEPIGGYHLVPPEYQGKDDATLLQYLRTILPKLMPIKIDFHMNLILRSKHMKMIYFVGWDKKFWASYVPELLQILWSNGVDIQQYLTIEDINNQIKRESNKPYISVMKKLLQVCYK
jgi:hypothetical protein